MALRWGCPQAEGRGTAAKCGRPSRFGASLARAGGGFPSFLPKEVEKIKDPFARRLARRIERVPVPVQIELTDGWVMSSCVKPSIRSKNNPVVLLHCFDSSCLEWRCAYPLLEEAGLEVWAVDVLGWGFSDLEKRPPCGVSSKRHHLYQLWKSHIRKPMVLVGPSLGAAAAIDFAVNHSEAVSLLKSTPLRLCANMLAFYGISLATCCDWTNVGRLHCLLPWWKDASVSFMRSGGYNVLDQIKEVKQKVLIVYGEHDRIVTKKLQVRLHCELPSAIIRQVPECGHLLHVEKPNAIANLIVDFVLGGNC
ncbi:uncharacterized hydrolase YugF-like isoform X2 [Rhodamnia argentea]|uniref:Uncharacterized hydrolase YugF-like isoform X2 n=1 Tax=Rhodamnia argentea TaxID=178133 RepID=A0ABM3GVJ3_9MYRT|nr:uncharacterized hydrolase YugF-like isoform X2 [Rhodamnia argentea]